MPKDASIAALRRRAAQPAPAAEPKIPWQVWRPPHRSRPPTVGRPSPARPPTLSPPQVKKIADRMLRAPTNNDMIDFQILRAVRERPLPRATSEWARVLRCAVTTSPPTAPLAVALSRALGLPASRPLHVRGASSPHPARVSPPKPAAWKERQKHCDGGVGARSSPTAHHAARRPPRHHQIQGFHRGGSGPRGQGEPRHSPDSLKRNILMWRAEKAFYRGLQSISLHIHAQR